MKKVIVIGSGFAGLSAASYLAKAGFQVQIVEKNDSIGGRARQFAAEGFTFDMGPSWYWMPDVFEQFYQSFNHKASDFYNLERLDPSYQVYYEDGALPIPAKLEELFALFDSYEAGSGEKLKAFLNDAKYKYEVGMNDFVQKPALSITEFMRLDLAKKALGINLFQSISRVIRNTFSHPKLIELLEFPVLFLGATPQNTPALYSLMNYADMVLGTWYPQGGMFEIVKAFEHVATEQNVTISTNTEVLAVHINHKKISSVKTNQGSIDCDLVVNAGDYHHFDQHILPKPWQQYSASYWDKRVMAPSSLLYYIGLDTTLPNTLLHHNLFFDTDFAKHAQSIYENHTWPENPLFYACIPSKTDPTVAPANHENLFLLLPVSTRIQDTPEIREQYFQLIASRLQKHCGVDIRQHIIYRRDFANSHFVEDYHSFRGNAYGLANTLRQTAFLKPKMKHHTLQNLYHAGQLTTPGPGVPPSIISGKVVAELITKEH